MEINWLLHVMHFLYFDTSMRVCFARKCVASINKMKMAHSNQMRTYYTTSEIQQTSYIL